MGRVGLVEPLMKAIAPVTMLLVVCAVSAQDRTTALKVDGGTNAFPWIAAERSFVAVAWGVTVPEGGADVYVAVSRDAGQSFGAPVRVNTVSGAARLGGELPPRVALTRTDVGRTVDRRGLGSKGRDDRHPNLTINQRGPHVLRTDGPQCEGESRR